MKNKLKYYHRLVAEVLIGKLKDVGNESITYGELSERINRKIIAQGLGRPLGDINCICQENNIPFISIIVHNKENKFKIPSDTFFTTFFPEIDINNIEEKKETYARELKKAVECNCWYKLLDELPNC